MVLMSRHTQLEGDVCPVPFNKKKLWTIYIKYKKQFDIKKEKEKKKLLVEEAK